MPVYEYQCPKCEQRYEIMESIAEMKKTKTQKFCRICEERLEKRFSVPTLFTETRYFSRRLAKGEDGFKDDSLRRQAKAAARRAGVSTEGKMFFPELCRKGKQFDPGAWCGSAAELRGAATRAEVGIKSSALNIKPPPTEIIERPYRVNDNTVRTDADLLIEREHGGRVSPAKRKKIEAEVREAITPVDHPLVPVERICSHKSTHITTP